MSQQIADVRLPIAEVSGWELAGWILIGIFIAAVLFVAWVLIEEARHNRRLRRMQRETMEAHQRETEITTRARFLP